MRQHGGAGLVGLAIFGLGPAAALAADIPGNTSTKARLTVSSTYTPGVFESPTDSDWYRVTLQAGVDYAVSGESTGGYGIRLHLHDANGKLLAPRIDGDGNTDAGFELRPTRTGVYFVEALYLQDQAFGYNVRVAPDCRGDRTTKCRLKPGVTQQRITAWC